MTVLTSLAFVIVVAISDRVEAAYQRNYVSSVSSDHWELLDIISTEETLYSVWGSGSNDIYIVGQNDTILHFDGLSWQLTSSGINIYFYDVWGNNANSVFVVGDSGTVLNYDGVNWQTKNIDTNEYLIGIWGINMEDVFVSGCQPGLWVYTDRYNGNNWTEMDYSGCVRDLWGSSSADVYAVGLFGIRHFDGSAWNDINLSDYPLL